MDKATNYQFCTFPWPPPNDRQDRRFYLFGFDADNQPYIVRWCDSVAWNGWRAVSLDTKTYDSAEPVAHAIEGENVARLTYWADAPREPMPELPSRVLETLQAYRITLRAIASGDGVYGAQAHEYKQIARAALNVSPQDIAQENTNG